MAMEKFNTFQKKRGKTILFDDAKSFSAEAFEVGKLAQILIH